MALYCRSGLYSSVKLCLQCNKGKGKLWIKLLFSPSHRPCKTEELADPYALRRMVWEEYTSFLLIHLRMKIIFAEWQHRCIMQDHVKWLQKTPQEHKEKQPGHHHLKFTGCLQFCFQSSVEPLTDSNLATTSTTAACKTWQLEKPTALKELLPSDSNQFRDLSICHNRVSKQSYLHSSFCESTRQQNVQDNKMQ